MRPKHDISPKHNQFITFRLGARPSLWLDQLYEMRLLLEPFVARKAAATIDNEQLGTLQRLAAEMRGEGQRSVTGYSEFAALDGEFHDTIAEVSGNELMREPLANLHFHIHLFRLFPHSGATSSANAEHAETQPREALIHAVQHLFRQALMSAAARQLLSQTDQPRAEQAVTWRRLPSYRR